jgi:hypothetical protein
MNKNQEVDYEKIRKIKLRDIIVATPKKRLWVVFAPDRGKPEFTVETVDTGAKDSHGTNFKAAVKAYNKAP